MEIFPAIDLRHGQAVRLTQGNYDQMTVYAANPVEVAADFVQRGAKNLHVVDLDGAKDGKLANFETIRQIVKQGSRMVQVGGGIRDEERVKQYLDLGVTRVILGTAALQDRDFLTKMVQKYGAQIAVGVDAKDGKVAVAGWKEVTDTDSVLFCRELETIGVQTIIYTDISKDGQLAGTNLAIYKTLAQQTNLDIVASGGITFEEEIQSLKKMNLYAAIVGKAVYTGTLNLQTVLAIAGGTSW